MLRSPGHLEGPQQSDAPEHGETDRRHDLLAHEDELHDRGYHHHKVKPEQVRSYKSCGGIVHLLFLGCQ